MFVTGFYRKPLFEDLFDLAPVAAVPSARGSLMRTDIRQSSDGFAIDIEMPGIPKDQINIELKDSVLTVSAEVSRGDNEPENGISYLRRERFSGSFSRSFTVEDNITPEDIKAKFTDGVLTIFIPRKEVVKPEDNACRIPIGE